MEQVEHFVISVRGQFNFCYLYVYDLGALFWERNSTQMHKSQTGMICVFMICVKKGFGNAPI